MNEETDWELPESIQCFEKELRSLQPARSQLPLLETRNAEVGLDASINSISTPTSSTQFKSYQLKRTWSLAASWLCGALVGGSVVGAFSRSRLEDQNVAVALPQVLHSGDTDPIETEEPRTRPRRESSPYFSRNEKQFEVLNPYSVVRFRDQQMRQMELQFRGVDDRVDFTIYGDPFFPNDSSESTLQNTDVETRPELTPRSVIDALSGLTI